MAVILIRTIILLLSTKIIICQFDTDEDPVQNRLTANASMLPPGFDPNVVQCIISNVTYGCDANLKNVCTKCKISCTNCDELPVRMEQTKICELISKGKNGLDCQTVPNILNCKTFETIEKVKAGFNICFGIVGIMGNFLVLLVTIHYRKNSSRCQFLIGGLAFIDLVFSAFQIAFHIPRLWTCEWLYGYGACKFLHSTLNLSYTIAIGFILLISIERYVGIVQPLSRWLTDVALLTLVGVNIMLGFASVSPSIYFLTLRKHEHGKETCVEEWPNRWSPTVYSWFLTLAYFLIPVCCIIRMYYVIIKTLRSSAINQMSGINEKQLKRRYNENKRIMVILVSILIAAVVLILPNRLSWLIMDHIGLKDVPADTYKALSIFGFIPYSFHTAINPIIYSVIDVKFRMKVKQILGCSFKKRTLSTTISNSNTTSSTEMTEHTRYSITTG